MTGFVWPILCALSMAWRSTCGFQSLSKIMTESAAVRFMPRPAALVDSRNILALEPRLLNSCIWSFRESFCMEPSILQDLKLFKSHQSSIKSSIDTNCEKIKTLWFCLMSSGTSFCSTCSLPEVFNKFSRVMSVGSKKGK